jgi:hypothetical protein
MRFGTHTVPAGGGQVASLEAQDPRGKLARVDLVTGAEAALGEGFERLLEADEAGVLAVRGADEVYLRGGDTYPVAPALLVVDVPAAPSRRLDRTLIWGLRPWCGPRQARRLSAMPRAHRRTQTTVPRGSDGGIPC